MNVLFHHLKISCAVVFIVVAGIGFTGVSVAEAATIYLSPSSGTYTVGQDISVGVYVLTRPGESMNGVSFSLNYPTDRLIISSFSKSGSIIDLWASEPTFSNQAGKASLEGVVLNPGYSGSSGYLGSFKFKVKSVGQASILVSAASVLANDGLGTNILTNTQNASFETVATLEPTKDVVPVIESPVLINDKKKATSTASSTISGTTTIVVIEPGSEATATPFQLSASESDEYNMPQPWSWGVPFVSYLSFTLVMFSLTFLLLFVILFGAISIYRYKQRVLKETQVTDILIHKSFNVLRDSVREHVEKIKKAKATRKLTIEEEEFLTHFSQDLEDAEGLLRGRVDHIGEHK